jgi:lipid-A-disaccharide synthase-like uncharacterized protein
MHVEFGGLSFDLTIWVLIGLLGQALFTLRFLVQWLSSERRGRSYIPHAFWWFSLAGGATLLAYALHRKDPVFILGQGAGLFIYIRNLQLILQGRKKEGAAQG